MSDWKTNAVVVATTPTARLGSPMKLVASKGLASVPSPTGEADLTLRGAGRLLVVKHDADLFLVVSLDWTRFTVVPDYHAAAISGGTTDLGTVNCSAYWRKGKFAIFTAWLNKSILNTVAREFGPRDDPSYRWLWSAFLPKRRPAAFRMCSADLVQLWIAL